MLSSSWNFTNFSLWTSTYWKLREAWAIITNINVIWSFFFLLSLNKILFKSVWSFLFSFITSIKLKFLVWFVLRELNSSLRTSLFILILRFYLRRSLVIWTKIIRFILVKFIIAIFILVVTFNKFLLSYILLISKSISLNKGFYFAFDIFIISWFHCFYVIVIEIWNFSWFFLLFYLFCLLGV